MHNDDDSADRDDHDAAGETRPEGRADIEELRKLIERARKACVNAQELIRRLDGTQVRH